MGERHRYHHVHNQGLGANLSAHHTEITNTEKNLCDTDEMTKSLLRDSMTKTVCPLKRCLKASSSWVIALIFGSMFFKGVNRSCLPHLTANTIFGEVQV